LIPYYGDVIIENENSLKEMNEMPEEENWLKGLCYYSGPASDLPLGGYTKLSFWRPENAVKVWIVLDAESEKGFVEKKTSELKKEDIIMGCTMNAASIEKIVEMFGRDFYQIRDANGGPLMTLDQWQEKYHSNGLGLVAIRNIIYKLRGGGVHFGTL
jgi:hypothetical protein